MAEWVLETTAADVEAALAVAKDEPDEPRIVDAAYEPKLDVVLLRLSDGRRLVYPRENLQALAGSTPEQAACFVVGPFGTDIWWPELDEGHYLPDLLNGQPGKATWMAKVERPDVPP